MYRSDVSVFMAFQHFTFLPVFIGTNSLFLIHRHIPSHNTKMMLSAKIFDERCNINLLNWHELFITFSQVFHSCSIFSTAHFTYNMLPLVLIITWVFFFTNSVLGKPSTNNSSFYSFIKLPFCWCQYELISECYSTVFA